MPTNLYSQSTNQPESQLQYASRKRLSVADWNALSIDLMQGVNQALADRAPFEQNLEDGNALYEMLVDPKDWPWAKSANVFVPLVPTELEGLLSYVAAQVLVPHLFLITGNNPQASQVAHVAERYYNVENKRLRGPLPTWYEVWLRWLHLGLRDGTGYVEAVWKYKNTQKRIEQSVPQMEQDPQTGQMAPVIGEDGKPVYEKQVSTVDDIYNDVALRTVKQRNIILIPSSAASIEEAAAVIKVEYLMEDELMELVHDGVLDEDEVEKALSFVPNGSSELGASPQPLGTYRAGDQVQTGDQGSQTSKFFKNRGPIEVYRIHSRQYDLDKDDTCEENVFWLHRSSERMLGWMRYQYFNGLRPIFDFSPLPRPDELLGFSIPERLAGLQNELNAQTNNKLDYQSLGLTSPLVTKDGAKINDQDMAWGLNQKWETEDPTGDVRQLTLNPINESVYVDIEQLKKDAKEYTGMANPMMGAPTSGKRSATEARQWQAAAMTRTGLMAMRFRMSIRNVINFVHALKKQYIQGEQQFVDEGSLLSIDPQILQQDFTIEVAGAADPIDAATRKTEVIAGIQALMQLFPGLFQDPMRQFYLARKMLSAMDWDQDADQLIGTEQQAMQQAQMMQQQAMLQQAMGQQPGQQQPGQHPPQNGRPK